MMVCVGLFWLTTACNQSTDTVQKTPEPSPPPMDPADLAQELAQQFLIADTHIDVPYRLERKDADISQRTPEGDFDYVRAKKGGLNAAFMSIYTPASLQGTGESKILADKLIDMVESFENRWPDKFKIARSVADVRQQFGTGVISLPLGMENGAPIEGDLANLKHFYDRGIRYITLTHGKANHICDSSYDEERPWQGMSPFGKEVITEMNRLGIMVDISHVSDEAFYQAVAQSSAPVIASHSSCRKFVPGFERNMDDAMIKKLAENRGVIMINFGSTFISGKVNQARQAAREHVRNHIEQQGWAADEQQAKDYASAYYKDHAIFADLDDVLDHFDHVVSLVGVDYVGIGSDYDGVGDSLPIGLKDASQYPNLIEGLLERGYSEADIEKICSGNIMRVWEAVEKEAERLQASKTAE